VCNRLCITDGAATLTLIEAILMDKQRLEQGENELRAEIERLRNSLPMQTIADQQTKLNEAAAFLDEMANELEDWYPREKKAAANCRTMAAKLRGEEKA
jgi:hypothetical protein